MSYETILVERSPADPDRVEPGGPEIATITLNRPEVRNAIDPKMIAELGAAFDELRKDERVGALVLSGSEKSFASGADISEMLHRGSVETLERIYSTLYRRIEEGPLAVVAAVRGYALGGGCELAMACDVRIAGRGAKLGQPEVGLGIIPSAGAIQRLPRLVGMGRAKELILTGRFVGAEEAERIGLVSRVVDDDKVVQEAQKTAGMIASRGRLAVRISKLAINAAFGTSGPYDILEMLGQALLFESPEKYERMQAFLDRGKDKKK